MTNFAWGHPESGEGRAFREIGSYLLELLKPWYSDCSWRLWTENLLVPNISVLKDKWPQWQALLCGGAASHTGNSVPSQ